jgi:hypothetical protein
MSSTEKSRLKKETFNNSIMIPKNKDTELSEAYHETRQVVPDYWPINPSCLHFMS